MSRHALVGSAFVVALESELGFPSSCLWRRRPSRIRLARAAFASRRESGDAEGSIFASSCIVRACNSGASTPYGLMVRCARVAEIVARCTTEAREGAALTTVSASVEHSRRCRFARSAACVVAACSAVITSTAPIAVRAVASPSSAKVPAALCSDSGAAVVARVGAALEVAMFLWNVVVPRHRSAKE